MTLPLKLGYKASAEQFAPRDLVEFAVAAEQHGFDTVTTSDHFQPWRHEGGHAPFSLTWMAAVGERTSNVLIGTSVMTPTFRYNPAVVAQAFATMGVLYPGRIFLGVGSGEALNEIATGWRGEWPEFKERFARLRESVELMRALWTGDRVTFEGEYYSTVDASIYDRPETPIPVVKEGAEQAERSFDDIDRMIEIKLSYDTDPAAALENTRFWAPLALSKEQKHDIHDPIEMEKAADALPIEQI